MNKLETMDWYIHQLTTSSISMGATVQTLHKGQLMMDNDTTPVND